MRATSRRASLDLGDSLPYKNNDTSWDQLGAYGSAEGGGNLLGDEVPAGNSTSQTAGTFNQSNFASNTNGHTYHSTPWLSEGDSNIWGHGELDSTSSNPACFAQMTDKASMRC